MYRGVHGWCPEDTWNLDIYLSKVISESVKYLMNKAVSYPHELTFKQWKKILRKISKDIYFDEDKIVTEKGQLKAYEKRKQALELFVKYFNFLWD